MSVPDSRALHEEYERELVGFVELVRSGAAFSEQATAERLSIRLVGVLMSLLRRHRVDQRGRCSICRRSSGKWWRLWPKRTTCTVHAALDLALRQPERFVLAGITENRPHLRGTS